MVATASPLDGVQGDWSVGRPPGMCCSVMREEDGWTTFFE